VCVVQLPWTSRHELEAPDNRHIDETFKRIFGAELNNVDYLGNDPLTPNGNGRRRDYFGERQLNLVRNVLANVPHDNLMVISFHIPLKTLAATDAANNTVDEKNFQRSSHPNTTSFCGHTHTNEHCYFIAAGSYPTARTITISWRRKLAVGSDRWADFRRRCSRSQPQKASVCCRSMVRPPERWCQRTSRRVDNCE
jgi:hypothetical protein